MNKSDEQPDCLRCGHPYRKHVTEGLAAGPYYCRVHGCPCRVYVKKVPLPHRPQIR